MHRRQILQQLASAALLASGGSWSGLLQAQERKRRDRIIPWRNWSGNQSCLPEARVAPDSEEAIAGLLKSSTGVIRPVGASHSFSALVPTDGTILSLARLSGMIEHDASSLQATFWAGTRMSDMGEPLKAIGQALPNMADIDYQTLAGALATATHGTGQNFPAYPGYVQGLRMVSAAGEIIDCSADENTELFNAARVSLGALGVITRVRLQNRDAFRLHTREWIDKTDELLDNFDQLVAENDHFEILPLIFSDSALAIAHNETDAPADPAVEAEGDQSTTDILDALYRHLREYPRLRTALMNLVTPLIRFEEEIDDSYKIFANVRDVRFHEMEYSVPAADGPACLREILQTIRENNLRSWFPMEMRYIKGDDIPLSMFEGGDRCAISVHQHYDMDHHNFFAAIEPIFWRYGGRPHWGKLHSLNARHLRKLYPRWEEFTRVRDALDPQGRFLNAHLRSVFGVSA